MNLINVSPENELKCLERILYINKDKRITYFSRLVSFLLDFINENVRKLFLQQVKTFLSKNVIVSTLFYLKSLVKLWRILIEISLEFLVIKPDEHL